MAVMGHPPNWHLVDKDQDQAGDQEHGQGGASLSLPPSLPPSLSPSLPPSLSPSLFLSL
jgi:hypothetical protein